MIRPKIHIIFKSFRDSPYLCYCLNALIYSISCCHAHFGHLILLESLHSPSSSPLTPLCPYILHSHTRFLTFAHECIRNSHLISPFLSRFPRQFSPTNPLTYQFAEPQFLRAIPSAYSFKFAIDFA